MAGCTVAFYFFLDIERERYNTLQANPICQKTSLWGSGRPKSALCISTVLSFIPFPSLSFSLFIYLFVFVLFNFHITQLQRSQRKIKKNKKANTTNSYSHIARWAFYLPLAIFVFSVYFLSHIHTKTNTDKTHYTPSLFLWVGFFNLSLSKILEIGV